MTFGVDLIIISMSLRDAAPQERLVWNGRLAQLGEHLPYKQGVTGSSPVLSTIYLARWCSRLARQPVTLEVDSSSLFRVATHMRQAHSACLIYASVAQSVEQGTENPRVVGSIPTGGTTERFGQ